MSSELKRINIALASMMLLVIGANSWFAHTLPGAADWPIFPAVEFADLLPVDPHEIANRFLVGDHQPDAIKTLTEIPIEFSMQGYQGPIIDAHSHPLTGARSSSERADEMVGQMDIAGVSVTLVYGVLADYTGAEDSMILELSQWHPDRLFPFLSGFDPEAPTAVAYVRQQLQTGNWKGLGELYIRHSAVGIAVQADNSTLMEIYALAGQFGVPVAIHFEPDYQIDRSTGEAELEHALQANPSTTFLMLHHSFGYATPERLVTYPNLFIVDEITPELNYSSDSFAGLDIDRRMVGTDFSLDLDLDYSEYFIPIRSGLDEMPLDRAEAVAYRNIAGILGLEDVSLPSGEATSSAEATPISGPTPAIEAFDGPGLPDWEHSTGVTVVNGTLRVEGGNFAFHGGQWGDLTLTVTTRFTGEGEVLVLYRWSDRGEYGIRLGSSHATLQRSVGQAVTELSSVPVSISSGEWVEVCVSIAGSIHEVKLNGETVLTATDSDPLPLGGIGFRVDGEAVGEFDDLSIAVSGGAPISGEPSPTLDIHATEEVSITPTGVPAYQALPWIRTGGPIGGMGYDIRYNFDDHKLWYVTDAWSGFHRSIDNGFTWITSNEGITSRIVLDGIPIFSATVDPHNPDIIWIGTQTTGDIFKSTDGGYAWIEMTNGIDPRLLPLTFRGFTIDPRTSDIVYAMGEIHSPGWTGDDSERKGLEMDMAQGVVFKTTDRGQNWKQIWRGDSLARYCWIDPRDPNVLYVSTGIFDREAANTDVSAGLAGGVGILKSTDGGQTWNALNQANGLLDLYIGSLYMHPQNPDMLLAAAGQNNWSGYGEEFTGGVYLTDDGGQNWQQVLVGELFSVVEYCTSDPNVAYAASTDAVYRSDDAGYTWQRFNRPNGTWGPPGIVAGFPIDMQCDPDNPMRVFVNNYLGGNFLSADGGQTWLLASEGYTGALIRRMVVASGSPQTIIVGSRSGLYRSDDGGLHWTSLVYPPEDMHAKFNEIIALAVDPSNADQMLTMPADLEALLHSVDGGQNWEISASGEGWEAMRELFYAPSDPTIIYAAVVGKECSNPNSPIPKYLCDAPNNGLYVSHDAGTTWAAVGSESVSGTVITSMAVDPEKANTLYVAIHGIGIIKTTDGGHAWSQSGVGLPTLPVVSLAIDATDPDIIFAGTAAEVGIGGGGIYRSTDGGLSWTQLNAGLNPEALVLSIVIDPTNGQIAYLGDQYSGVSVTTDGGDTWSAINNGLSNRQVNILALSDDGAVLYAGVEGGGVFRLGMPPTSSSPTATPLPGPTATPATVEALPATATVEQEPRTARNLGFFTGAAITLLASVVLVWLLRRRR